MSGRGDVDDDAWKIFNRDNEAGRLLSRLYGVTGAGRPSVTYPPKRRRKKVTDSAEARALPARSWKTTYAVHGWSKAAEEERERERKENIARALSLAVPKVGRGGGQRHSVNDGTASQMKLCHVPRRTTEVTCRRQQEETREKALHYRPSATDKYYELDKRRLQGGSEGTGIPGNHNSKAKSNAKSKSDAAGTLFDQIVEEVRERRQHQMELEELGAGEATREATARAIKERLERLKQLDSQRACSLVQKLMK